jgi:predicted ATPase
VVRQGGQPLMLVLDDLHAADTPSILLLEFVARELSDARVLVLGALS